MLMEDRSEISQPTCGLSLVWKAARRRIDRRALARGQNDDGILSLARVDPTRVDPGDNTVLPMAARGSRCNLLRQPLPEAIALPHVALG